MQSKQNIFDDMTQIISLDCSSIIGCNQTISHTHEQSLKQSLLNLKSVLPTFTHQFNQFREQMIETIYFTVNKLMNVIKNKNTLIVKLEEDLQKSQLLTNGMKNQVIQLKQMINEFVQSYNVEISAKDKEIKIKQKEILQIKNVLRNNFNSPRNKCLQCQCKINFDEDKQYKTKSIFKSILIEPDTKNQSGDFAFLNSRKGDILIEMSQSILFSRRTDNLKPLEVIHQECSDINSITDYLHSQRLSPTASNSQMNQQRQLNDQFIQTIRSTENSKANQTQKYNNDYTNQNQNFTFNNIDQLKVSKQRIQSSRFQNKNDEDQIKNQRQRRCSQQLIYKKLSYPDFHIQMKCSNKNESKQVMQCNDFNKALIENNNVQVLNRIKNENLSKSSSNTEILHLGDTDRINIPKRQQSPKNMNFVKKNSARIHDFREFKQQRLKTQPTPTDIQYQLNKENIHIKPQLKATELNRKIFAKKKNIKSHLSSNNNTNNLKINFQNFIQSPQKPNKPLNVFKASIIQRNLQDITIQSNHQANYSIFNTSNISSINQSFAKSHHEYHSAGKNVINTPKALKSSSKSKQKIKVTSKQNNKYLIDEFNGFKKGKGSIHLGVKVHLKKTLQDIKNDLQSYSINNDLNEIYYDGKHYNLAKQGYGKIIYENGIIYEGMLKKGLRTGDAKMILNGIDVYEGQFANDKFNGSGFLKSLRYLSRGECPKNLENASYFGKFQENKFDGMGTLFLNQKQKIVTKFKNGIPFGQLTYYTQNDIQFGYWPTQ